MSSPSLSAGSPYATTPGRRSRRQATRAGPGSVSARRGSPASARSTSFASSTSGMHSRWPSMSKRRHAKGSFSRRMTLARRGRSVWSPAHRAGCPVPIRCADSSWSTTGTHGLVSRPALRSGRLRHRAARDRRCPRVMVDLLPTDRCDDRRRHVRGRLARLAHRIGRGASGATAARDIRWRTVVAGLGRRRQASADRSVHRSERTGATVRLGRQLRFRLVHG